MARAAATFDFLSEGRLTLGLGAGWLPEEFEIAGTDFRTRGRRMDEGIRVMRELWEKEEPAFRGEFYSFPPARFEPKPAQKPGIPITIGGESERAMRRAATLGDGWCARFHTPDSLRQSLARIRQWREEAGQDPQRFLVQCRVKPSVTAIEARALFEAGAHQANITFRDPMDEAGFLGEMERLARDVLAGLQRRAK